MTNQPGTNVQVSLQAQAGSDLSYSIAGNGVFPDETDSQDASAAPPPSSNGRTATSGPGGGLGRPEDGPDGLAKYRWFILAALVAVLIGGGIWTHERTLQDAPQTAVTAPPVAAYAATSAVNPAPAASLPAAAESPAPSNLLLTALKEEMFTLEVEHQQGKLSQAGVREGPRRAGADSATRPGPFEELVRSSVDALKLTGAPPSPPFLRLRWEGRTSQPSS